MKKFLILAILIVPSISLAAPATWNPSDKSSGITLSNSNKTVVASSAAWENVRSTIGKSSGKWYWEVKIDTSALGDVFVGIANLTYTITAGNNVSVDNNAWAYYGNGGNKFHGADDGAYGASFVAGDVVGVALDMDAGTLKFYKNNSAQGTAYSSLTGTMYALVDPYGGLPNGVTANFGATTMQYTAPSGYCQGLKDPCIDVSPTTTPAVDFTTVPSYRDWALVSMVTIFLLCFVPLGLLYNLFKPKND